MYSKLDKLFALSGFLLMSACGARFGESSVPQHPMNMNSSETGCLEGAPDKLAQFIDGKGSEQSVQGVFSCADLALKTFGEKTTGAQSGIYNTAELSSFLERYFLNGQKLPASFYESALELKAALIGGSKTQLTTAELQKGRDLIRLFGEQLLRIKPFLPIQNLMRPSSDANRLDEAAEVFADVGLKIGQFLETTGSNYSFSQFDKGLEQLSKLLPTFSTEKYRSSLNVVRFWKSVFVAPPSDTIEKNQWSLVLAEGIRWYFLLARFEQASLSFGSFTCGPGRERLSFLANESLLRIKKSLILKGANSFPLHEMDAVIDVLPDAPLGIAKNSIKELMRPLVLKILKNQHRSIVVNSALDSVEAGLSREDIDRLRELLQDWNIGQKLIEYSFVLQGKQCRQDLGWDQQFLGSIVSKAHLRFSRDNLLVEKKSRFDSAQTDQLNNAVKFINLGSPLWEADRPEVLLGRIRRQGFSYLELSLRNTSRVFMGAVFAGYGNTRNSDGTVDRLTEQELQEFYLDVRDVGASLQLMDPRLYSWASYRFREGNVFTPNGNGDKFLSLFELTDAVVELIPARSFAHQLLEDSTTRCRVLSKDIFGFEVVEDNCFFGFLKVRLNNIFNVAPRFGYYYRDLDDASKNQLMESFRKLVLPEGMHGVESSFAEVLGGIIHFEELLLERYDTNHSGGIDQDEAIAMLPVFRDLLATASGLTSDSDLEAVLTYTLAKGEPPTKSLTGIAGFLWWRTTRGMRSFHADRLAIFKVFSAFASSPYAAPARQ